MRVTLAVRYFENVGGMEKFTLSLADFLLRRGHKVRAIAIEGVARQGIDLVQTGKPRCVPRPMRDWATGRRLAAAIRSDDADVVLGEQKMWNCDVLRPAGGVEDEYWKVHFRYRGLVPLPGMFRFLALKRLFDLNAESRGFSDPRLRRVIVNSEMIRSLLQKNYPSLGGRVTVVYEGIDTSSSRSGGNEGREQVLNRHGLDPKRPTAVFVGHDFRRKGLRYAIQAVAAARRKAPDFPLQLLVLGRDRQGPYRRLAARLGLDGDVAFAGALSPVDAYLKASDLLLFPSFYDPFANVTLEALSAGVPVLTTRQNGGAEIITEGQNGWVMDDPASVDAMADALLEVRDTSKLMAMKQRALQAASKHALGSKLKQIEEILLAVAEERKRARKP